MKKILLLSALILCCCMISISCDDGYNYTPDRSLTGSISYGCYSKSEGIFDEIVLDGTICHINKLSDTTVSFYCNSGWGGKRFIVYIPDIPVSGEPYDVAFDHESSDAHIYLFLYDQENDYEEHIKYESLNATIKGWMKETTGAWASTRSQIACPSFDCGITITCTTKDGKEANIKITYLEGRYALSSG